MPRSSMVERIPYKGLIWVQFPAGQLIKGGRKVIDSFHGKNKFLSNFYPAPVMLDGKEYSTVEHAYQAAKTLSIVRRVIIRGLAKPGDAKKYGKDLEIREDWEDVRLDIMKELVTCKFTEHVKLKEKLLATGNQELIEGNYWGDMFWGVYKGQGKNNLGRILMRVREKLREMDDDRS